MVCTVKLHSSDFRFEIMRISVAIAVLATLSPRRVGELRQVNSDFSHFKYAAPQRITYQNITLAPTEFLEIHARAIENWQMFHNKIHKNRLYDPLKESKLLDSIFNDLKHGEIIYAEQVTQHGTQLKLLFRLKNSGSVIFKPKRSEREEAFNVMQRPNQKIDRHNAEIAAFHLDKVLGFNRVPPVVGRVINVAELEKVSVSLEFSKAPDGSRCFQGVECVYCGNPACGSPELLEGSVQMFIPALHQKKTRKDRTEYPWRVNRLPDPAVVFLSRNRTREINCDGPKASFGKKRRLLDLIDLSLLDYITGNRDRHELEYFPKFGDESALVFIDHGKGFISIYDDYTDLLGGLLHCCLIRHSTLQRLLAFHNGPLSLGEAFWISTKTDPLFPVVVEEFITAINRRVRKILQQVQECVEEKGGYKYVVLDDGF